MYGILQPGLNVAAGVPYVRPSEIHGDQIQLADLRRTTPEIAAQYKRASLKAGDVLLSIVGTIGKVALVPPELEGGNITQSSVRVRPGMGAVGEFLRLLLKSPQLVSQYDRLRLGTGVPRLNVGDVRELQCPLPPLNEQRRIVAKLEALQARSRRAREALDAVPPLLEKLRQSILAAAFRGDLTKDWRAKHKDVEPASELLKRIRTERKKKWEEAELVKMKAKGKPPTDDKWKAKYKEPEPVDASGLPELPRGWCWAKASDVVAPDTVITYGIVLPGAPLSDGVPYVRGQDIEDGRILVDQLWRTSQEIAAAHSRSELAEGDVLLCIIRHLKVAIVPSGLDGANLTQGTVRMRPSLAIVGSYLARYLEGPIAQGWMKARYFGNAMPRINVEDAREIPIPIAPRFEQEAILGALATHLAGVQHAVGATAACTTQQASLERSMLAKAFRGELVPQDPNDEPADVMLSRLAAAKDDAGASTRSAKKSPPKRSVRA